MRAALTSVAYDLALATGRETAIPAHWLVLRTVQGPWDRLCDEIGWLEAIRCCATDPSIDQRLSDMAKHVATDVRSLIKVHHASATSIDSSQQPLFGRATPHGDPAHADPAVAGGASVGGTGHRTPAHITIGDHFCSEGAWVLDPEFVRDHIIPLYRKVATAAASYADRIGAPHPVLIAHSEGDFADVFPDLAAAGMHGIHIAGVDYSEVGRIARAATSVRLAPFGGISAASLLPPGLPDSDCRTIARAVHSDGLIPADDGGLTDGAQLDALIDGLARVALY